MNTRSNINHAHAQKVLYIPYIPVMDKALEVTAYLENEHLTRLDLKIGGGQILDRQETDSAPLTELREGLIAILNGADPRGRIAAMARGTLFQIRVWATLMSIPYGTVITYSELAQRLGCESPRAVGQALKANPLPLIIPCHRVISKNDWPGGYSCSLDVKRLLLMNEIGDKL
ncbi:MAG: methylated-DNA--[protein]-cysteine S-methyltransferase [Dissulfurimicrobium sp.]|uniref:methylated-DNA--[protein]-cysteine S-methyltransferase n=1 Tax=Dissulfurimicrobium sp. TaxID=2022436 RepID=UPI00404B0C39